MINEDIVNEIMTNLLTVAVANIREYCVLFKYS